MGRVRSLLNIYVTGEKCIICALRICLVYNGIGFDSK